MGVSFLGRGLLGVVFLLCSFAACFGLVALKLQTAAARKALLWVRQVIFVASGCCVFALVLLAIAFLRDDFSIATVGQYSSRELPVFYKLSAVWAGSAGSLLLWSAFMLVLFAVWLAGRGTDEIRFEAVALSIGAGVCVGFSVLLVFVEKPFASSVVAIADGAGLNPLLQNFWNVIHPPLLFVGYSAFLIPFVIVLAWVFAGAMRSAGFYKQLRRWLLFGICFLGLGIATGARWSYVELGWGGYWAWDPVENASLLPWLFAVAVLHSLVGIPLAGKFKLWTAVVGPVPFILCLVATFITRSGVLASVHAFGYSVIFTALLVFIGVCLLLWGICIVRAVRTIKINYPQSGAVGLKKSELLFWANVILISAAIAIGAGTFWPVISPVFMGSGSVLVPTRLFYDRLISVVGIVLAFLVGLSALADFQRRKGFLVYVLVCCAAGVICFGLLFSLTEMAMLIKLACAICLGSGTAIVGRLVLGLKSGGRIGGSIAHLGLLALVISVGISSTERSTQVLLNRGQEVRLGEYTVIYDSFKQKSSDGLRQVGPEVILAGKGVQKRLWPHNNIYSNGQRTSEVAVHTGLLEDVYLSFDSVSWDGRVAVEMRLKPFMLWLWFALLLIAAGSAWAIFEDRSSPGRKAEIVEDQHKSG